MCGQSSCDSPYLLILTARENVKSISFDIWQHKNLLAFKPCENCYSLHDNMANTNSIVVAAIDSEYFAIIFAKRDRCCRGRHLYKRKSDTRFAERLSCDRKGRELFTQYGKEHNGANFF